MPETPTALQAPQTQVPALPEADEPADSATTVEQSKTAAAQSEGPADPLPETAEADEVPLPAFDEVRREADGTTVVAGRAAPGGQVSVLQDGQEIARADVDVSGAFATIAFVPPDGKGHVLTLVQTVEGIETASLDQIILAPLSLPVQVAEAAPAETSATQVTLSEVVETPQTAEVIPEPEVQPDPAPGAAPAEAEVAEVTGETPETEVAAASSVQSPETAAAPADEASEPLAVPIATGTEQAATTQVADSTTVNKLAPTAEQIDEATVVAVLKTTPEGVELLNPAAPLVMDNVAIDTISYSDVGDVQLAGRAQSTASSVRVYLDNAAVVSLKVDDQGRWRGDLPDVDEGIYTLRIDEMSEDGSVTSRVETPFKREAPAVLAAASAAQGGPLKAITVQKGATLWAIARDRYGQGELYVRVFEANRAAIRDPDLIYPGQIFELPD
ncbi:MAG: LysM peptidoglycan-binding domain-containing protein [Sulfitobacter sp.]|nr:LysM peptidoglycan-binding domain-containing protein [Sulfitobacter sp.]